MSASVRSSLSLPPTGIGKIASVVTALFCLSGATGNLEAHPGSGGLEITDTLVQAPHDSVPRFGNIQGAGAPIIANVASGDFSDPAIWPGNVVPGAEARVQIASGTVVTYDLDSTTRFDCIEVQNLGHLAFATGQSTKLCINELMVMPDGELTIGTEAAPVADHVTAEIIFRGDTALKTGTVESPGIDPRQYGKGLIVFGKVRMHGRVLDETYIRFSQEPLAGQTTLSLESPPTGWMPGDLLLIPDTRHIRFTSNHTFTSQAEEVVIESISGNTITLTEPLAFDHRGPRDVDGNVGLVELSMLPHVGNLTRNIVLRSENPNDVLRRGHTLYLHRADVDLRYATFKDLGRTTIENLDNTAFDSNGDLTNIGANQIGRYSIHLHHLWGLENPEDMGYQLKVIGTVMDGMRKWGMTIHDTHYGLFQWNIAYDGRGSAIATEDGNESYNVFERNFVVHTKAGDTQPILGHSVGRGGVFNTRALFGTTRDAFWFSGEFNYVRDNVAANSPDFAFNYNGYYIKKTMRVPRFRGANMFDENEYEGWNFHEPGQYFVEGRDRREGLPVLESARNEVYSSGQGLWLTWARGCCSISYYKQESLFEDYRLWHINHTGVYAFHESRNTYRGFIMRNDPAVSLLSGPNARLNRGFYFGNSSYENGQLIVSDFDVQGFNVGMVLPPNPQDGTNEENLTLIENGVLKNHVNIIERFPTITDGKTSMIRNVQFTPTVTYASNRLPASPVNLFMDDSRDKQMHPMTPSRTLVYDFNGQPGDSFEVFWELQAPDAIVPPAARPDLHADDPQVTTPEPGLTNRESLLKYGIVTASAIAPCDELDGGDCSLALARAATRDIVGLVFPMGSVREMTYPQWLALYFNEQELANPLLVSARSDPEKDSLANLLEYALDHHPKLSDPVRSPVMRRVEGDADFVLAIPPMRSDLDYVIEVTTDFDEWFSGSDNIEMLQTIDGGDGLEYHFFRGVGPFADADAIFTRLTLRESTP